MPSRGEQFAYRSRKEPLNALLETPGGPGVRRRPPPRDSGVSSTCSGRQNRSLTPEVHQPGTGDRPAPHFIVLSCRDLVRYVGSPQAAFSTLKHRPSDGARDAHVDSAHLPVPGLFTAARKDYRLISNSLLSWFIWGSRKYFLIRSKVINPFF